MELNTKEFKDNIILNVNGAINIYNVENIKKESTIILGNKPFKNLILNLENSDYVDSSGIATLNFIQKKVRALNREMYLVNLNETIKTSLELSGLGNHFKILESKESI